MTGKKARPEDGGQELSLDDLDQVSGGHKPTAAALSAYAATMAADAQSEDQEWSSQRANSSDADREDATKDVMADQEDALKKMQQVQEQTSEKASIVSEMQDDPAKTENQDKA